MRVKIFRSVAIYTTAAVFSMGLVAVQQALAGQAAFPTPAQSQTQTQGGGQGWRGRGGMGGFPGGGRGVLGSVTEVAADHYTIKTDSGETYTVHFSVNTRIMKQPVGRRQGSGTGDA